VEIDINYDTYSELCKHMYNTNNVSDKISDKVSENQVNGRVTIWLIIWVFR